MNQNCLLLLLLFSMNYSYSQEDTSGFFVQSELVHDTYDQVNDMQDLILFDNLLNDSLITVPSVKAMVFMARAEKHWDFLYDELLFRSEDFIDRDEDDEDEEDEDGEEDKTIDFNGALLEILEDYDNAIILCQECSVEYQFKRFMFLQEAFYNIEDLELSIEGQLKSRYSSDSLEMRNMGYKDDRVGLGFGLNAIHGDDNWIGGELSAVSFLEPLNRLKYTSFVDGTTKRYWINKYPIEASWLSLGYNYNISKEYHDFYFDFMNISSPIHVTLMKFGALKTNYSSTLLWYYRPEIGIGFGNVSVYYAYNAIFKKSMRELSERHMIGVRIKLIPVKYY